MGRRIVMVLLVAWGVAGCDDGLTPAPVEPTPAVVPDGPVARATLDSLAVILTGRRPADASEGADDGVEAIIDRWLSGEDFARRVAPDLLFGGPVSIKGRHPVPSGTVLKGRGEGPDRIYHLRSPCLPEAAVEVDPWWDPGHPVKVCPDAYRPDRLGDDEGRTCGSTMLDPGASPVCGCGPRLMYCARDKAQLRAMRRSLKAEVIDTAAARVHAGGPIDRVFTANETVRDRYAEFVYRRGRVAAGADPALLDLDGFDETPRLAPRVEQVPGQHAGVLTASGLVYGSDALRGVLRNFYVYLWCAEPSRSKVETAAVMKLGKVDLRVGDGWRSLAAMDICTDCHARLDYGMQFFKGYPSSVNGVDFRPAAALDGQGPLYAHSIDDPRGEGPLTPAGFARLAMAQPEFGACLSRRVVDHVFAGDATVADFDAVEATFARTRDLREMARTAALRFAARPPAPHTPAPAPSGEPPAPDEHGPVALGPALRQLVDNHCVECHDEVDDFPFHAEALPRAKIAEMLDLVAFGAMPATARGLDDETRRAFVEAMVPLVWRDPDDREQARRFHLDAFRAHPVHGLGPAMGIVAAEAGAKAPRINAVEYSVRPSLTRYSPGFAAASGLTALAACKAAGEAGDGLADCIRRASAPEALIVGGTAP